MRRIIILAGALALLPAAAYAQGDGRDWDRRGDWMQAGDRDGWRGGHRDHDDDDDDRRDTSRDSRSGWRDQGERRGGGPDQGRMGMGMGMGMMGEGRQDMGRMHHEMMMRRMGGASFMLRAGDVRLAVRCSASESMKACVDAATSLMDQAKSVAPSAPGRSSGPSGSSGPGTPAPGGTTQP